VPEALVAFAQRITPALEVRHDLIAFTDGDRQFRVADIGRLTARYAEGGADALAEAAATAARELEAMVERVPAGLGQVRPPVLSASDDPPGDDTAEHFRPPIVDALDDDIDDAPDTEGGDDSDAEQSENGHASGSDPSDGAVFEVQSALDAAQQLPRLPT